MSLFAEEYTHTSNLQTDLHEHHAIGSPRIVASLRGEPVPFSYIAH